MKCQHCKSKKDLHVNSRSRNGKYVYYMCRKCTTKRMKRYRNTEEGRKIVYRALKKSEARYPLRRRARSYLNGYISQGLVKKPKKCENCLRKKSLQGHHEDYTKPLIVKWLCRGCHADLHKAVA